MTTCAFSGCTNEATQYAWSEPRCNSHAIIEYTQHSVAWPQLRPSQVEPWHTDQLLVGYDDEGPGGEFSIAFMTFDNGSTGVQVSVFGDGLDTFYDERIQRIIATWRAMGEDRDNATPAEFIRWLTDEGAVPSSYHLAGLERTDEETERLRAMRR